MEGSAISTDSREGINKNLRFIIENITVDEELVDIIKEKIFKCIEDEKRLKNWNAQVCSNIEIYSRSTNLLEAIKCIVQLNIEKYLTTILYVLERHAAFKSFFTGYKKDHGIEIREMWLYVFGNIRIQGLALQNLNQSNYLTFTQNLRFPFSKLEYEGLKELVVA